MLKATTSVINASQITGTLPVANGGTGLTSYTANGVVYASGSTTLASGSALTFDGTNFSATGTTTVNSANSSAVALVVKGETGNGIRQRFIGQASSGQYNWQIGASITNAGQFEFIPSTIVDGTTFSTAVGRFSSTGLAVTGTLSASGELLVGTTSSSFGGRVIVSNDGTATQTSLSCINTNGSGTMRQIDFFTGTNTSRIGSIESTTSTTAYNTSSDYRLKNTIKPMTGALAKVALLKPCTYKWNADGSNGQGFIAHELAEVVPDCVSGKKDAVNAQGNPEYQGIDTSFLVATLTAAIQEQQVLIKTLSARLTALESK